MAIFYQGSVFWWSLACLGDASIEAGRILMIFILFFFFAYLLTLSEPPICPRNMKLIWCGLIITSNDPQYYAHVHCTEDNL